MLYEVITAAPIVLDLALLIDWAQRSNMKGVQEWLGFFLKAPLTNHAGGTAKNDLFYQYDKLEEIIRANSEGL